MYSSYFNGWIGKLDEHWTKEARVYLFGSLVIYFQKLIISGQKIFISYDYNQSSKYMALEAAEFFSQNGIPVFISNRPLTTSMLQIITKERFGCGSLSFVRDDYPFPFVGLKVSRTDGQFVTKKDITSLGDLKKHKKQPMDWFEPVLNLKNYIEANFNFTSGKAINSLVWNAMYSPLSPILEELFVKIFEKDSIDGYTINSYENMVMRDLINEFEIQSQIDLTSLKMNEFLCHYGITTSPDLSKIDLLVDKENTISSISLEEIISRLVPYLKSPENLIISKDIQLHCMKDFPLIVEKVSDVDFIHTIASKPFSIAIDENYNIYLQNELFSNHFATLFCLFHSLIYNSKNKKLLGKIAGTKQTEETKS